MYSVSVAPSDDLILVTFAAKFWDLDVVDRFVGDCVAAGLSLGRGNGAPITLVDLRNAVLQSGQVIARIQSFLADPKVGRIALVANTPLARMQTKRLQVRDGVRLFDDMDDAEAWLRRPQERAIAA